MPAPTTTPATPTETPEVPTETPTEESTPKPEPKPESKPKPGPKKQTSQSSMECINGVFVTKVNGQVVSKSGTCGEDTTSSQSTEVVEEGL